MFLWSARYPPTERLSGHFKSTKRRSYACTDLVFVVSFYYLGRHVESIK